MNQRRDPVLVLGAGLQGVCAALALARVGHRVTVVDAEVDCLRRASLRNEGKVHLGFVYANDPTGSTPSLMLEGALAFGPLIESFVGRAVPWEELRSVPFTYLVMEDSLLDTEQIHEFYGTLDTRLRDYQSSSYLGRPIEMLWEPASLDALGSWPNRDRVQGAVRTCEVAVDREGINSYLRSALHGHENITVMYGHQIREARRTSQGFAVSGTTIEGDRWVLESETVVNCLWDHRLFIDAQLDIAQENPWVYRQKYRILGNLPPSLKSMPSLTMVLGSYGDVVVHLNTSTYISWYPACMTGWSTEIAPPGEWHAPEATVPGAGDHVREICRASIEALSQIVDGFDGFEPVNIASCVIVAKGDTDIDDPGSRLHTRHDIGVREFDGWFSVDTGKYTTAPLFARHLAEQIGALS